MVKDSGGLTTWLSCSWSGFVQMLLSDSKSRCLEYRGVQESGCRCPSRRKSAVQEMLTCSLMAVTCDSQVVVVVIITSDDRLHLHIPRLCTQ